MADRKIVKDYKVGDAITAKRLNELVKKANRSVEVGPGLFLKKTSAADIVGLRRGAGRVWIGQVAASDDTSSSDWSDNRYFVHPQRLHSSDGESDIVGPVNDNFPASDWAVATNLAETEDWHHLSSGDYVLVYSAWDNQDPPVEQHVFCRTPRAGKRWAWAKQTWSSDSGWGGGKVRAFPVTGPDGKVAADSDNEFTCYIASVHDSDGVIHGTPNVTSGVYFGYELFNDDEAWATYPPSVVEDGIAEVTVRQFIGTIADIPAGWRFCDGANGTPDMRGRFPVGAYSDAGPGLPADSDVGAESDYNCIGELDCSTYGYLLELELCHPAHCHCIIGCDVDTGTDITVATEVSEFTLPKHSEYYDVRPPWIVMGYIMRSDNSITWTGE